LFLSVVLCGNSEYQSAEYQPGSVFSHYTLQGINCRREESNVASDTSSAFVLMKKSLSSLNVVIRFVDENFLSAFDSGKRVA
jgi:hypothetical protein